MVCSGKKSSFIAALFLVFVLPLKLYADWPFNPSFISGDFGGKPAVHTTVPAAANSNAVPAANTTVPKIVTPDTREVAPFAPTLSLRSQLITVDSEWRGAVLVNGGITIGSAATLTISPGTVVRFAKGSGMHVLGRIVIKGTRENPVRLASLYRDPQDSDWSGIFLSGTEKRNVLENVVIEGAEVAVMARFSSLLVDFAEIGASRVGFKLQGAVATITNTTIAVPVTAVSAVKSEIYLEKCLITGGQSGVVANSSAVEARDISIKSCRLTAFAAYDSQLKLEKASVADSQAALHLSRCEGSVSDSLFSNNLETGVVLTGSQLRFTGNIVKGNRVGLQIDDNLPSLWANTIAGNSKYNLLYLGDDTLFACGNSFDGNSAEEIENKIFSKRPGAVQIVPYFPTEQSREVNSSGVSD